MLELCVRLSQLHLVQLRVRDHGKCFQGEESRELEAGD